MGIPSATETAGLTASPVSTVSSPLMAPSGTRTIRRLGELRSRLAGCSPKRTSGRRPFSASPRPWMAISPPVMAAFGSTSSM